MYPNWTLVASGQSYKAPTIVICNPIVVSDMKLPHITTLRVVTCDCKLFIGVVTGQEVKDSSKTNVYNFFDVFDLLLNSNYQNFRQ